MRRDPNPEYGSHVLALIEAVQRTHGPIMEYGVGYYSTPLLEVLAHAGGRALHHVEHDLDWLTAINPSGLVLHLTDTSDPAPLTSHDRWGLVLLDQGPTGEERWPVALKALQVADLVLLHDSQPEHEHIYHYRERVLPHAPHHVYDERIFPPTLVCASSAELLRGWPTGRPAR